MPRLLIRNGQVVTPTDLLSADVLIEDEQIVGLVAPDSITWPDAEVIDATGCYVMPGLVDPHTHVQLDTGIYKTADDWEIGTKTAAFGGITTLVDFATQFPGMTFPEALENRLNECRPAYIDYSHHMMVTDPPSDDDAYRAALTELRDLGVPSIKLYTTYRPNYYMDDAALLRTFQAMPEGMMALVHCENDAIVSAATQRLVAEGKTSWAYHGQGRPWQAEVEAVARVVHLAMMAQATVYIVHCTMPRSLKHINRMRQSYPRVYGETCPQYFTLNEDAYTGPNPEHHILQPPLRSPEAMTTMRDTMHLADVISTDHCDYSLAQKQEFTDFTKTPGGLPGLETSLQLTMQHLTPQEIVVKMSATPAKLFGLYPRKGALLPGSDADVVIYNPRPSVTIRADKLHTIGGYTPYEGLTVQGYVRTTISRGMILVDEGKFYGKIGRGRFLKGAPFSTK
ncbi:MAG: dihydropyrimidinase [Anaerolineales bacterium]|nr:dihydropyrimidinase [Anaerolineales bacterium]